MKACEADPRRRYQTADQLRDELALLQNGHSVKARRVRERRWATARRLGLAAAAVAGVVTLAGALASFLQPGARDMANGSSLSTSTSPFTSASAPLERNSIAVLPIVSQRGIEAHDYLCGVCKFWWCQNKFLLAIGI